MSGEYYDFIPVKGSIVRPKKPGSKPHRRRGHYRWVKVNPNRSKKSKAKKLRSVTANLATDEQTPQRFTEELAPLLQSIDHLLNGGTDERGGWQANPRYGIARRITKEPYGSGDDEFVIIPFTGANQARVLNETHYIQQETPDHVITSTWGTIEDWAEYGEQIRPEEIDNGLDLYEDENFAAGTMVYHETQTVGYEPKPLPEVTGRTPTTDAIIEVLTEQTGVRHTPLFMSAYWAEYDEITIIPDGHTSNHVAYIHNYLHELAHATGHPSRLNRPLANAILETQETGQLQPNRQDLNRHEEVVAEIAATIAAQKLVEHYGRIHGEPTTYSTDFIERSAKYVLAHLPKDERDIERALQAAIVDAEQAADWILARTLGT